MKLRCNHTDPKIHSYPVQQLVKKSPFLPNCLAIFNIFIYNYNIFDEYRVALYLLKSQNQLVAIEKQIVMGQNMLIISYFQLSAINYAIIFIIFIAYIYFRSSNLLIIKDDKEL